MYSDHCHQVGRKKQHYYILGIRGTKRGAEMRLDKFLKDARLVKRRTIAKQMCDAGKVKVNEKRAKPGLEVEVDDIITIEYKTMFLQVQVLSLRIASSKVAAQECYRELARIDKSNGE